MPIDRGAIDAQLRDIGEGDRWWEHREFRDLPHILHADEKIQGITSGRLLSSRRPRVRPLGRRWLVVATNLRLVCLKQERFARKQVEIAAGQVTRIYGSSRLRGYQIIIETMQRKYRLRIPKEDAFRFAAALDPLVATHPAHQLAPGAPPRAWLPGMEAIAALPGVSGIVAKFSARSADDYATRAHVERLETVVERLHDDVERLQQQVTFLEDLLQKRAEESFLPRSSAHT
jgi:hypothetical protein